LEQSKKKKSPLSIIRNAHSNGTSSIPNWISSIASYKYTDLVASGSADGFIKLWSANSQNGSLSPILSIEMVGFVNSLVFSSTGRLLIAGIGQEHRLGRWSRIKEAKNGIRIIPLPLQ